ncbi:MAG: ATP-dependent helicase [Promethearchaeota archaeon]
MGKKKIVLRKKPKVIPPRYKQELNSGQYQAVIHEQGPALVIAGAGTGKTRMLTYRCAYLIEMGTPADSIVLVTFTKKAAQEMIRRVEGLIGPKTKGMYSGTFHHLANLILRRYAQKIGFENNFTILDQADQKQLMKIIHGRNITKDEKQLFPKPAQLCDIYSKRINLGIKLAEIIDFYYPSYTELTSRITKIINQFVAEKKKNNQMDFDDLLVYFLIFLQNHNASARFRQKIRHVLVDEFQDVNAVQAKIIRELAENALSITVVGDDAQSIYRFRGANFKHMLDFPVEYENTTKYFLETNYRSTPEILALANVSIAHNEIQFEKNLKATRQSKEKPMLIPCKDIPQEADLICQQIQDHREEGIPLNEQAVLFRSKFQTIQLEQELIHRKIPYEMRAGTKFFEQAHIKDLLSSLAIIVNPKDQIQWIRILSLHSGITSLSAEKIIQSLTTNTHQLEQFVVADLPAIVKGKRIQKVGVTQLKDLQHFYLHTIFDVNTQKILPDDLLPRLPQLIKSITKYITPLIKKKYQKNFDDRLRDFNELTNFASQYNNIASFLADILTQYNIRGESIQNGDPIEREKSLILSTIHQAKGLEWKIIYLINLAEGRMPSSRAIGDPEEIEEERRLFYVACTRAKDILYLTYPIFIWRQNYDDISGPSRFIEEIRQDNVFDEVELEQE